LKESYVMISYSQVTGRPSSDRETIAMAADDAMIQAIISYHIIWICYGVPIRSSEAPYKVK